MNTRVWLMGFCFCLLIFFTINCCYAEKEKTLCYLIPEGSKGWVQVVWGDPRAKPLVETKDEILISFDKSIVAVTSSPESTNNTKYYFVDKKGKRKEIPYYDVDGKKYPKNAICLGDFGFRHGPTPGPTVDCDFLGTQDEIKKEGSRPDFPPDGLCPYPLPAHEIYFLKNVKEDALNGYGVGSFPIGTEKSEIEKEWGQPDSIDKIGAYVYEDRTTGGLWYDYEKQTIKYTFDSLNQVSVVSVMYPKFKHLTLNDAIAILGNPDQSKNKAIIYVTGKYELWFLQSKGEFTMTVSPKKIE